MKRIFIFVAVISFLVTACSESAITEALEKNGGVENTTRSSDSTTGESDATAPQDPSQRVEKQRKTLRKWRKVASWEGTKGKKTSPFEVKGNEWKIRWKVKKGKKIDSEFIIILQNYEDKDDKEIITQQIGPGEDDFTFEGGQGTYILDVSAELPYVIEVLEFK